MCRTCLCSARATALGDVLRISLGCTTLQVSWAKTCQWMRAAWSPVTEINPSVIGVSWQELSRSWTAQPGLGGRKNVREMWWDLHLALCCPVQGRIARFTLHVANGSFSAVAAAKTRGLGFILSLGSCCFCVVVFFFFSFFNLNKRGKRKIEISNYQTLVCFHLLPLSTFLRTQMQIPC